MGRAMASTKPASSLIYQAWNKLSINQTIPSDSLELLGERLAIAFAPKLKEQRRNGRRRNLEYVAQHRRKIARKIYLEILEKDPNIFLPFILAVSPRACLSFDISSFLEQHQSQGRHFLRNNAEAILWGLAKKHDIDGSLHFRKLMREIFQLSPPATEAEGKEHYSLHLSTLPAIRNAFGDVIFDAIERSPTQVTARAKGYFSEKTESVWTKVPYRSSQDAIISLEVGSAIELANVLFPIATQKIVSILSACSPTVRQKNFSEAILGPDPQDTPATSSEIDVAYFTLRGATVSAIESVFRADICEGIKDSELRNWEKEQLLIDTTDCVTMQIWRAQPQHGTIKLRIGFYAAVNLANRLYAETPQDHI